MTRQAIDWLDKDAVSALMPDMAELVQYFPGAGYGFSYLVNENNDALVLMSSVNGTEDEDLVYVGVLLSDDGKQMDLYLGSDIESAVLTFRGAIPQ